MEDCLHEYQTLDVDVLHHDRLKTTKVNQAVSMEAMSFADLKKCIEEPGGQLIFAPCDKNENGKLVDLGFTREYEGRTNHLQTFCGT